MKQDDVEYMELQRASNTIITGRMKGHMNGVQSIIRLTIYFELRLINKPATTIAIIVPEGEDVRAFTENALQSYIDGHKLMVDSIYKVKEVYR